MLENLDIKDLLTYKKADLQKLAKDMGLDANGTVKELTERIAAVEVEAIDEEPSDGLDAKEQGETEGASNEGTQQQGENPPAANVSETDTEKDKDEHHTIKIKVVDAYHDKQLNRIVEAAEELTVEAERAELLVRLEFAKLI